MTTETYTPEFYADGTEVRRDCRYWMGGDTSKADALEVGDRVWFRPYKAPFKVRARGTRYIILTKPFNIQRTVLYTVIDLAIGTRGADNYGGLGYESEGEIADAMARFNAGDAELSVRNNTKLDIVKVDAS